MNKKDYEIICNLDIDFYEIRLVKTYKPKYGIDFDINESRSVIGIKDQISTVYEMLWNAFYNDLESNKELEEMLEIARELNPKVRYEGFNFLNIPKGKKYTEQYHNKSLLFYDLFELRIDCTHGIKLYPFYNGDYLDRDALSKWVKIKDILKKYIDGIIIVRGNEF